MAAFEIKFHCAELRQERKAAVRESRAKRRAQKRRGGLLAEMLAALQSALAGPAALWLCGAIIGLLVSFKALRRETSCGAASLQQLLSRFKLRTHDV